MTLASGSAIEISYVKETTPGVTPGTPSMKTLRATERNINPKKELLETGEKRKDRQVADQRHGFRSVEGSLAFELAMQDYDDVFEGVLGGTWSNGATFTGSLVVAAADDSVSRGAGSWLTDNFKTGMTVTLTDGINDGDYRIKSLTATKLFLDASLTDFTGSATVEVKGQILTVGTTLRTYTMERRFTDVGRYQQFLGTMFNTLGLAVQPEEMAKCTLGVLGMDGGKRGNTTLGTPSAPVGRSPFSAFDGTVTLGGAEIATITAFEMNMTNDRSLAKVLGRKTSPGVFNGTAKVNGNMSFILDDAGAMDALFYDEIETDLALRFLDLDGTSFFTLGYPRVKVNADAANPPQEGAVVASADWSALYDVETATSLFVQRYAAP